jgi:hypothetical protein
MKIPFGQRKDERFIRRRERSQVRKRGEKMQKKWASLRLRQVKQVGEERV